MEGKVVVGMDHEVIHIDDQPSFRDVVAKDVVHKRLEGGWGVALSKEHD